MMERESTKHILLCVAGGTPQIITETLWALTNRGKRIDEVRVVTTLEGRNKVCQQLLQQPDGIFYRFCRDFPRASRIKFDENCLYILTNKETGIPSPREDDADRLQDILTTEDNERAANQICEIVRDLTRDKDTAIHATVAGGRKTMGLYLMAAMQLFGRPGDELSHVLVSPEVESHRDFYYKPPTAEVLTLRDGRQISTDDAQIYLADIPFIRLRGVGSKLLTDKLSSYAQVVTEAQERLKLAESAYHLRFDIRLKKVLVATKEVKLHEREFFVYMLFAHLRKYSYEGDGFIAYEQIERKHLDAVCRLISAARGKEVGFDAYSSRPRCDYLDKLDVRSVMREQGFSTEAAAREEIKTVMREIRGKINRKLEAAELPEEYLITKQGGHFEGRFGLKVEPARIGLP